MTESPPATVKAIDLHRAAKLEHPFVNLSLSPLPSDVCFTSVNVCPDFVVSEPALINGEAQTEKLESGGRNALYQIALYEARKLELNAIQADLRARIRSEQAEISQIQVGNRSPLIGFYCVGRQIILKQSDCELAVLNGFRISCYSRLRVHSDIHFQTRVSFH